MRSADLGVVLRRVCGAFEGQKKKRERKGEGGGEMLVMLQGELGVGLGWLGDTRVSRLHEWWWEEYGWHGYGVEATRNASPKT